MRRYASTDPRRLGAPRCDAIDAELVGEGSDLFICGAWHLEGGWRHHGKLLCWRWSERVARLFATKAGKGVGLVMFCWMGGRVESGSKASGKG